jgi:hypothetical protein
MKITSRKGVIAAYIEYKQLATNFVEARNRRITNYYK